MNDIDEIFDAEDQQPTLTASKSLYSLPDPAENIALKNADEAKFYAQALSAERWVP